MLIIPSFGGLVFSNSPKRAHGLSPLEIEAARLAWSSKRYPDESRRLKYLESIGDHLARASQLLLGYQTKVSDQSLVLISLRVTRKWDAP
jgi:hypothetical protein